MTKMPSPTRWRRTALALAFTLGCGGLLPAHADERNELERLRATTLGLIDALVSQGLLTRERADAIVRQASAGAATAPGAEWGSPPGTVAPAAAATGNVIRVPYVSETLRAQLREEIRNDVLATARDERWADPRQIPEWVRGIQLEGDLRVRYQAERFAQPIYALDTAGQPLGDACEIVGGNLPARCYRRQVNSPAWFPDATNTTTPRDRITLRARLGVNAKVADDVTAALRFSTGSNSGPTSSSQTLGTQFNKGSLVLDRAFIRWEPRYDFRMFAGRMPNPFFSTDLTWPDDLSFDGFAAQGEANLAPGAYAFATAGVFPLEEFNLDRRDKWLYALQVGVNWAFASDASLRVGLAVYDFARVEGVRESAPTPTGERAGTEPYLTSQYPSSVRLKGNTLINVNVDPTIAPTWGLASKFRPINLTALLTYTAFNPVEIGLGVDWIRNTGFDLDDIRRRAAAGTAMDTLTQRTSGLQARLQVGSPKLAERGQWLVTGAYRRFERDAWVDGFTDTTWHLGGTNYKGWQLGGQVAFDRRSTLGLRVTSSHNLDDGQRQVNPITGALDTNFSSAPLKIDVLQLDLNTRF